MAGLLKRLFGKRDGSAPEESPDIDDMLDWSPGPTPPAPSFRVSPPPPPPPPPPALVEDSTQLLWGAPAPAPPVEAPKSELKVRLMLADGSVIHPPATPEWQQRFSYLAANLFPPGMRPRRSQGLRVRIFLADGTVIEEAQDRELQARIRYAAENLLPRGRRL
jgi:hypothetical protein